MFTAKKIEGLINAKEHKEERKIVKKNTERKEERKRKKRTNEINKKKIKDWKK